MCVCVCVCVCELKQLVIILLLQKSFPHSALMAVKWLNVYVFEMKLDNFHPLEYSDYFFHLYCDIHNDSADASFGLLYMFHVKLVSRTVNFELDLLFNLLA